MKTYRSLATAALFLFSMASANASTENLLKNPGFEDPAGWSTNWIIRDADGDNLTYHYRLTSRGGGHGDAVPRTGDNALEIYTTDRQTYLVQKVQLEPGTYRLSAWARANGMPDYSRVQIALGEQKAVVPVISQRYRQIWADFNIETAGEYEASFHSSSYGMAVDDLSLTIVAESTPPGSALYVELHPSSKDRAAGIQYCLKGSLQWVNFVVTCADPKGINRPVMRILAADPVKLTGLNEELIHSYRMRNEDEVKVESASVERDGQKYQEFSFPLPRFVSGYLVPQGFGGFWVSNVPERDGKVIIEVVDGDDILASEVVQLIAVEPPEESRTPRRYHIFGYAVQDWKQSGPERIEAIPAQFKMMGFNVWSDYGLPWENQPEKPTKEELVLKEAYERYGIRQFWPNFASMLETFAGAVYLDISEKYGEKNVHVVGRDGTVNKHVYNFNYAANKGRAWMESAVPPWTRALRRPAEMGLPYRYSGLVNDGLEGLHDSYDPSTLAAFAAFKGVAPDEVNVEKLLGEWNRDWQLFKMDCYTRIVEAWTEQVAAVDPAVKLVNTASTYGPSGFSELTASEAMNWARTIDYNMPQWYASGYFGTGYADNLREGENTGVYGKDKGGTDLLPLLNLSMGAELEDPESLRFKLLDFFSSSSAVKGVGYYIATYAFSDAKCMVGLSRLHTLIADIEDYYADGERDDGLVSVTPLPDDDITVPGMDLEGNQITVKPVSNSSVRVHKLNRDDRTALITVVTYSDISPMGGRVSLTINRDKLPGDTGNLVLIDRLTGSRQPLPDKLVVDTTKTRNVAVYEIVTAK